MSTCASRRGLPFACSAVLSAVPAAAALPPPARWAMGTAGQRRSSTTVAPTPASLDPALSTDVQSGRSDHAAVRQPDPVRCRRAAPARASPPAGRSIRPARIYTFHLRTDATFHDGRPVRAGDVRASILRALRPGSKGGRQWPLLPDRGRPRVCRRPGEGVEGIVGAQRLHDRVHADGAAQHLPQVPGHAGGRGGADARRRPGSTSPGGQRAVAVRVAGPTTTPSCWPGTAHYWGGPPKSDTLRSASSPRR